MATRRRGQRGAALMALLVAIIIAFLAALVSGLGKWETPTTTRRNVNAQVLAQAKRALIGYVAKEALDLTENIPGRMPCPESPSDAGTSGEGVAASVCTPTAAVQKTVGRLPWRTLGLDKVVDADAEPLWYAVSPNWASGGLTLINSGTAGQLSFDGTGNVVAVIIAPGRAISTTPTAAQTAAGCVARSQARNDRSHVSTSTTNPDYRDYLECQNASSPVDSAFGVAVTDNATNAVINDQAVVITSTEILNALQGPLAERMQRTVAPLLNEYGKSWVASGTILPGPQANTTLARFMPYAAPFAAPESATPAQNQCGSAAAPTREGLLPIAAMALSGSCASPWGSFAWTIGSGAPGAIGATSCSTDAAGNVTCRFDYYTLNTITIPLIGSVNLFQLLGVASPPTTATVTVQANAPYAASAFRKSLSASDFNISPSANIASASFTQTPSALDGSASLSVQLQVSSGTLCTDRSTALLNVVCSTLGTFGSVCPSILGSFACSLLSGAVLNQALMTANTVSVRFPALSDPTNLQGTQLSAAGISVTPPLNLLNPTSSQPHYWFFKNEWYRYTYYAVAPGTSAAQTGGALTVNLFPATYGSNNDKRFVLALMGPAMTGQSRSPTAAFDQYVEGANAANTASPRVFAYQVFNASGNDRMATCPFTSGVSICD